MATQAEINARKAVVQAMANLFNQIASSNASWVLAAGPLAAEFQTEIIAMNQVAGPLQNVVRPAVLASQAKWNAAVPSDPPPPTATESTDGTLGSTVTDSQGHVFSFGAAQNGGMTTLRDGQPFPAGAPGGAVEYFYKNHTVYCRNSSNGWFVATTTWVPTTDPRPVTSQPPGPSPITVGQRLNLSRFADHLYVDSTAQVAPGVYALQHGYGITAEWAHLGGDWRDINDVSQGPADWGHVTINGQGAFEIDLAPALIEKLRLDPTGIYLYTPNYSGSNPMRVAGITSGQPVLAVTNTAGQTFTLPATIHAPLSASQNVIPASIDEQFLPVAMKHDYSQITGTVATAKLKGLTTYADPSLMPQVFAAQFLDTPVPLTDPQTQTPSEFDGGIRGEIYAAGGTDADLETHQDVIHVYKITDLQKVLSEWDQVPTQFSQATGNPDWRDPYRFMHLDEYDMDVVEIDNTAHSAAAHLQDPQNDIYWTNTLTSWRSKTPDISARRSIHMGWAFIPVDVKNSKYPVKLPGMMSKGAVAAQAPLTGWFDLRVQHSMESPDNPGILRMWPHYYYPSYNFGPEYTGSAKTWPLSDQYIRVGQLNWIEQEVILESSPNASDGIIRMRVNGRLCHEEAGIIISNGDQLNGLLESIHHNIFAGGTDVEYGRMVYRVGTVVLATRPIGPPKKIAITPPQTGTVKTTANDPLWLREMEGKAIFSANPIEGTQNWQDNNSAGLYNYSGLANNAVPGHMEQYCPGKGGHAVGSADNSTTGINFKLDRPSWTVRHPGSSGDILAAEVSNILSGGTIHRHLPRFPGSAEMVPCGAHLYSTPQVINKFGIVVRLGCLNSAYPSESGSLNMDGYRLSDNTWLPGTHGDDGLATYDNSVSFAGAGTSQGGTVSCKHQVTEEVFWFRGANPNKGVFTSPTELTWTNIQHPTAPIINFYYGTPCVDPNRNMIIGVSSYNGTPLIMFRNLTTGEDGALGFVGDINFTPVQDGVTICDPIADKYYWLAKGFVDAANGAEGRLYEIDAVPTPAGYSSRLVATIPGLTAGGSGPWNRAEFFPDARGILISLTSTDAPWFGKTLYVPTRAAAL